MNRLLSTLIICSTLACQVSFAYDFEADGYAQWQESDDTSFAMLQAPDDGEQDNFSLRIQRMTHHELQGKASSDFGRLKFKSRLFANNDVRFSLFLDAEDKELVFQGYIDIVEERMELDGGGAVLTADHRKIIASTSTYLMKALMKEFEGELPLHGLMLTQMMSYWSHSPDDFVHDKRSITPGYGQ